MIKLNLAITFFFLIACSDKTPTSSRVQTSALATTKKNTPKENKENVPTTPENTTFTLSSKFFSKDENIPQKNTCESDNLSPALTWDGIPHQTKSFVLIMDDLSMLDSNNGKDSKTHWLIYNISAETLSFDEGAANSKDFKLGMQGKNDFNHIGYDGPCLQPQDNAHDYVFKIFALKEKTSLEPGKTKQEVLNAITNDILEVATLQTKYISKAK